MGGAALAAGGGAPAVDQLRQQQEEEFLQHQQQHIQAQQRFEQQQFETHHQQHGQYFELGEGEELLSSQQPGEGEERVNSTLFHELGRSLPPYMKTGAALAVDWDAYVSLRRKHAPALAWGEEQEGGRAHKSGRAGAPARPDGGPRGTGMFPSLVPRPPPGAPERPVELPDGMVGSGAGMSNMMRALRDAAAAHGRNAEVAHAHAIVNPKLARRDIEKLLKDHERDVSPADRAARKLRNNLGGNKRSRRLRVADPSGIAEMNLLMKPKPPKGRKGRGKAGGGGVASDAFDAPALQPMPRFAGAGPVANGNLLRPSRAVSDGFTGVGTF